MTITKTMTTIDDDDDEDDDDDGDDDTDDEDEDEDFFARKLIHDFCARDPPHSRRCSTDPLHGLIQPTSAFISALNFAVGWMLTVFFAGITGICEISPVRGFFHLPGGRQIAVLCLNTR